MSCQGVGGNQESHLLVTVKMLTYVESFTNHWVQEFKSART